MSGLFRRLAVDRRGAALVEFVFLLPVLLTFLFGTVEVGRMVYVRQGLEYATEEAARYYVLNPSTAFSNVTTQLQNKMPGGMGPSVNVTHSDLMGCNGNTFVICTTITATYVFNFAFHFSSKTLRATAKSVRYVNP